MNILAAVLLGVGLLFSLTGAIGVVRMRDVYSRVQYTSMMITVGTMPVLVAVVIAEGPFSSYGAHALIMAFLLIILNPASSHALLRAAYRIGVPQWHGARTEEGRDEK